MAKKRLDLALVERGLFATRTKAQAAVMAGKVRVEGLENPKAGSPIREDAKITVLEDAVPFVSRGGVKLEAAMKAFGIRAEGRMALDVGASTGGFTDCLLKRGAARIFAVDVGHGQLDASLRKDPRVVNIERTHARDLRPELFEVHADRLDLAVIDVSFISATKILPVVLSCLQKPCEIILLIKPQFELEPKKVPKGVVRKDEYRAEAIKRIREAAQSLGLTEKGLIVSPAKGPKGNFEFLIYLTG